jgi:hypothetical protein
MIKINEVQIGDWIYFPSHDISHILLIINTTSESVETVHVKFNSYGINISNINKFSKNKDNWRDTCMRIDNPQVLFGTIFK